MKAHLLFRDRDIDWRWVRDAASVREAARSGRRHQMPDFDPRAGLPWNEDALRRDLALDAVWTAMAGGDDHVFEAARSVTLAGVAGNLDAMHYRQDVLRDCLGEPVVVRELYGLAVEAVTKQRGHYLGPLARHPDSVLHDAVESMAALVGSLRRLREIADRHGPRFVSEGWTAFFRMARRELDDDYLALVESHLDDLRLRHGVSLSAELGRANKGQRYLLHRARQRKWTLRDWWAGLFADTPRAFTFEVHPRDEAGARALGELRQRGVSTAARALAQAADHVREFFGMLRAEAAFYVGCLNVHDALVDRGEPTCIPEVFAPDERRLLCRGLYDVALALTIGGRVVGNDVDADGKALVIITGPNTGGKSTFLRSVGLAQLLMQCGMFVPATAFAASLRDGVCTHFKREEDAAMESGKFDEELDRMSDIVDHIGPRSLILFNEPFAATNEREGSEIARQIMAALLERGVRIVCVTHMFELAHGFHEGDVGQTLFLRAARRADGVRTFKLAEGEPLPTSFGEDLYRRIFGAAPDNRSQGWRR